MGHSIANAKAYCKKDSTSTRVAIGVKVGIRASSNKNAFRLS
jgi:hypothetical protein